MIYFSNTNRIILVQKQANQYNYQSLRKQNQKKKLNSLFSLQTYFFYNKSLIVLFIQNIMQKKYPQVDSYDLIMRNPNKSLSWSKQSSKFPETFHHKIEILQFNGNIETDRLTQQNKTIQTGNKQMKYMYSFCDQNFKIDENGNSFSTQNESHAIKQNSSIRRKQCQAQYNLAERLTFENQTRSPFIRIQPPSKNINQGQQIEFRHSFNPMQNKVNELQKICKKLYQISHTQSKNLEFEKESIQRIQQKIDFLLQTLKRNSTKQSELINLKTRSSNQNKKRSSIPQQTYQRDEISEESEQNSSEQLSRYLQPLSSSQSTNMVASKLNVSKNILESKIKKTKPFVVNNNFTNQNTFLDNRQNSVAQLYGQNKENFNQSNLIGYQKSQTNFYKGNTYENTYQQTQGNDNFLKKQTSKTNYPIQKVKQQKKSDMINKKIAKQVKTKNQQVRKQKHKNTQNQDVKKSVNDEDNLKERIRTRSQNTAHRKRNQDTNHQNVKYHNVSITTPNEEYENQLRYVMREKSRGNEQTMMQNSEIFRAMDFSRSSLEKNGQSRQFQPKELCLNHKRRAKSNHNKTLLESIEEKKRLIDSELSKRLMKNSSILYAPLAEVF